MPHVWIILYGDRLCGLCQLSCFAAFCFGISARENIPWLSPPNQLRRKATPASSADRAFTTPRRAPETSMGNDNDKHVTFEELVAEVRKDVPGRVTTVSYAGIKFARDAGIDCWHLAGSMCFQHVIHDHGTPEEKQRLREMRAGYWA
jgi:hypothetical protein